MEKAHLLYLQNRVAYARDPVAYKELFLHFHPKLYQLALGIINQDILAEEIVSDVMTRIWTMENRLAHVEALKIYLLTAVRNTAYNYAKKRRQDGFVLEADAGGGIADPGEADQPLIASELSGLIENAVQSLPRQCQQVFRLIKEEGLSYQETGAVLGLSQNTLETHMRLALKKLKVALDGYLLKKK
ncbi:sigma-70 family RNA polymerase sigma factor [Niabella hirudinis]|uniref:sigma-70 family RNA polymerase sigma factor n=1 Tax=Niabella hirudinis TaxID=1285929 RepID=UPI003EBD4AC1